MTPGMYPGLSRAEYEAIPAANYSTLKHYAAATPAHARERIVHPKEVSDAMKLGNLCDCAILEPSLLEARYCVLPDFTVGLVDDSGKAYANPRGTKKYKQLVSDFGREHVGKDFVSADELTTAKLVAEAIATSRTATELLTAPGDNQVAIVWIDPDTGLLCKALLDRLCTWNGERCVVDLKTTEDGCPPAFRKSCELLGYDVQAASYLKGLACLDMPARHFIHVVAETVPPYGVAVHEMTDAFLSIGIQRYERFLGTHAECTAAGRWPCYPDSIQPLDPSPWFGRQNCVEP